MIQDAATKATLEMLYRILLSAVVQLAAVLGKDCPVETRAERRQAQRNMLH
jgi:hypothetical protein